MGVRPAQGEREKHPPTRTHTPVHHTSTYNVPICIVLQLSCVCCVLLVGRLVPFVGSFVDIDRAVSDLDGADTDQPAAMTQTDNVPGTPTSKTLNCKQSSTRVEMAKI